MSDKIDRNAHPFDWKLDKTPRCSESFRNALVNVNDTIEFAWASAKQNFGSRAKPEHAIEICKLVLGENKRLQLVDEISTKDPGDME